MNTHEKFALFFKNEKLRPFAYLVSKKLADGHICISKSEDYVIDFEDSIYRSENLNWEILSNNNLVSSSEDDKKPFIYINENLYLYRYYNYETQIISNIKQRIQSEDTLKEKRASFLESEMKFIEQLQVKSDNKDVSEIEKVDWQLVACLHSFMNNFSIITGGPGTGKTTTIAKLLALIYKENPNLKVALAAPTGKAGNRMIESLVANDDIEKLNLKDKIDNLKSFTIHRLLGYKRNSTSFKHNAENPLIYDVVIVDEASMIDMALFSRLMEAIKQSGRIIFLGDKEQLASVEAGSLFGDLCNSLDTLNQIKENDYNFINQFLAYDTKVLENFKIPESYSLLFGHIIELKRSYRFHNKSEIGKLSQAIINSNEVKVKELFSGNNTISFDFDYEEKTVKDFVRKFESYIEEKDTCKALDILNSSKIICAVKNGPDGVYEINKKIEQYLRTKIRSKELFYENRPVLVTKNYRDLDLFNGDIGIIRDGEACFLDSNHKIFKIKPSLITECETAFAMTIHKSQGSEYDNVLVILPKAKENRLLTRELLYTAVTRAKEQVIIQATEEVILTTIQNSVKRYSGIIERIK